MKYLIFSTIILFCLVQTIPACSITGNPKLPLNYFVAKTNIILIGEVVEKQIGYEKFDGKKYPAQIIKLKIVDSIKGMKRKSLKFRLSDIKLSNCDSSPPNLQPGERWVFFGDYYEGSGINYYFRGKIYDRWFKDTEEEKSRIEKIKSLIKFPVTTIQGQIDITGDGGFTSMPASDIDVTIEGNNLRAETKTDANGDYKFESIPPGRYKIKFRLAFKSFDLIRDRTQQTVFDTKTNAYFYDYETEVRDGDSDYRYFDFAQNPDEQP